MNCSAPLPSDILNFISEDTSAACVNDLCKNLCMDTSNSEIGLECQSRCKGAYVRKKRHMFVRVWVGVCVHVCEWVYVSGCVCVLCVCVCAHVCA